MPGEYMSTGASSSNPAPSKEHVRARQTGAAGAAAATAQQKEKVPAEPGDRDLAQQEGQLVQHMHGAHTGGQAAKEV